MPGTGWEAIFGCYKSSVAAFGCGCLAALVMAAWPKSVWRESPSGDCVSHVSQKSMFDPCCFATGEEGREDLMDDKKLADPVEHFRLAGPILRGSNPTVLGESG